MQSPDVTLDVTYIAFVLFSALGLCTDSMLATLYFLGRRRCTDKACFRRVCEKMHLKPHGSNEGLQRADMLQCESCIGPCVYCNTNARELCREVLIQMLAGMISAGDSWVLV